MSIISRYISLVLLGLIGILLAQRGYDDGSFLEIVGSIITLIVTIAIVALILLTGVR